MARGFQGAMMRGFGARDHIATVLGTTMLAPHFMRVRMKSPTLFTELSVEPAVWLRFWFPDPDGSGKEHQRAYTLVESDRETGEFAVDIVLHEPAGPATVWARGAEPGMSIPVMAFGSTRFAVPDELPAGYLLIGDPASIPAINAILAALPAEVDVELYLERQHPEDELIPLGTHPRLRLRWVDRDGETSLAAAVEDRDWSDWYAWLAPEAGSLKHLRTTLRDRFGFPKQDTHAQAYWVHGRAMGTLRGAGDAGKQEAPPVERSEKAGRWRSQAVGELFAPIRSTLIAAGVLQAVVTLVQLAPFVLLVDLATRLVGGAGAAELRGTATAFLVVLGAGTALGGALMLWLHAVDARFGAELRRRLLGKLGGLPLGWFTRRGSGQVKSLVQDDTLALHSLVTHAIPDAVAAVVAPLAVLVYLFTADWRLALVLLVPILVYLFAFAAMMFHSGAKIAEASRWAERMGAESAAYLDGQPVVRVFGGAAASPFRTALAGYTAFLEDWQRPFIGRKTFIDLVTRPTTFLWLIAAVGTPMVAGGALAPAELLPFLLLGTTFGARLLGIGYGLSGIRAGSLAARRIAAALAEPELTTQDRPAAAAEPGTVHFDRVGFAYRKGDPVLSGVSLTLRPGTVTALVGPSGSGKSTLAALLARFHDVDSGAIRVGGRDIRTMTGDELYSAVGFVFQDVRLVHGTVRENIALARPDATDAEVEAAARDAHIHDRVTRLPEGYDTVVSDGVLSGGERQRVTIARALLADTPVLILDEATAFADPESEHLVQRAITRLTRDRTVLVIAHRLTTVADVDQIAVLDGGRIVETGVHAELLAAGGRYRRLWDGHHVGAEVSR